MVSQPLKLIILDAEDLDVISAQMQDAVMRFDDLAFLPQEKRFALVANRFNWENESADNEFHDRFERRRCGLHFERVLNAQMNGIDASKKDAVLSLLAIRFEPTQLPAGYVEFLFAGGANIRLEVECIEAQFRDLGAMWETRHKPEHGLDQGEQ